MLNKGDRVRWGSDYHARTGTVLFVFVDDSRHEKAVVENDLRKGLAFCANASSLTRIVEAAC